MFLLGLFGSVCATVGFTFFSDIPGFTVMWSINRFLQSMGWGALVKITSNWFSAKVSFFLSFFFSSLQHQISKKLRNMEESWELCH